MRHHQQDLKNGAEQFGIHLTKARRKSFELYSRELINWNKHTNLTRIVEPQEIVVKHFLDSLSVYLALSVLPTVPFSLIDVGSGAGFPGLPLKIACPDIQLTLLETSGKKAAFLQHITGLLKLSGVAVLKARAEEVGQQPAHREQYTAVTARAVASLPILVEYMLPLLKVGGVAVLQKGQYFAEGEAKASQAVQILGGVVERIIPVSVPGLVGQRHLVVLRKEKATPLQYPRRAGMPQKRPFLS